jgi:hypothetical protein
MLTFNDTKEVFFYTIFCIFDDGEGFFVENLGKVCGKIKRK